MAKAAKGRRTDDGWPEVAMGKGGNELTPLQAFEQAYEWFANPENQSRVEEIHREAHTARKTSQLRVFFKAILDAAKQGAEGEHVEVRIDKFKSNKTKSSLATPLRHHLRAISGILWPNNSDKYLHLEAIEYGQYFRPIWKNTESPMADAEVCHRRIVVAGKLFRYEFSADFMLGAYSMARELGIELVDRRGGHRTFEHPESRLKHLVQAMEMDPASDALLVVFDDADKLSGDLIPLRSKGFHIVTTGYSRGTIHQADTETGRLLGQQCVDDEKAWRRVARWKGDRLVCVIRFAFNEASNPPEQRRQGSWSVLEDSGLFELQEILVTSSADPPYDEAAAEAVEKIREAMAGRKSRELAAVFPRSEVVTQEVVRFARSLEPQPRVYGERLLSSELRYLSLPDSPLVAICGALPFYYGRYAVRAASCRWETDQWPEIPPLLITREKALECGLTAVDRIASCLGALDPELNAERYAWAEWMRKRCRGGYGPDMLAKRSR